MQVSPVGGEKRVGEVVLCRVTLQGSEQAPYDHTDAQPAVWLPLLSRWSDKDQCAGRVTRGNAVPKGSRKGISRKTDEPMAENHGGESKKKRKEKGKEKKTQDFIVLMKQEQDVI